MLRGSIAGRRVGSGRAANLIDRSVARNRVEVTVSAADVDDAVDDHRGGDDGVAGGVAPLFRASRSIDGVERGAARDIDDAAGNHRGCGDGRSGREEPLWLAAALRIERVQTAVGPRDVYDPTGDGRRCFAAGVV